MIEPVTIVLMGRPVPAAQRNQFNAIPRRQKDQIALIRLEASRQMQNRPMLCGPLSLSLAAEVPIPVSGTKKWKAAALAGLEWPLKRPDLKNLLWLVEDSLTSVVYADDSLVCRHSTEKRYGTQPKIVVTVAPIVAKTQQNSSHEWDFPMATKRRCIRCGLTEEQAIMRGESQMRSWCDGAATTRRIDSCEGKAQSFAAAPTDDNGERV